ncbi:MAG: ATP-dependent helicase, partial [Actinobacteria bacterium]|nr:ATP-dependent helicase [Actinomycetota bacterium]
MLDIRIKEAIDKKSGNLLIIGPPGTGKTNTLINIIGYLLQDRKIDPRKVLVFCFNRRWAKFIRERSANFIGKTIFEVPVETFYSFCIDFLEKVNAIFRRNYVPVKVLNSVQQWKLLREIVEGADRKNYPYTHKLVNQNPFTAQSYIQEVFDFILRAQENLLPPRHLSDRFTPFLNPTLSEIVGIYARYRERLHGENSYNYGRLLEEVAEILRNDSEVVDFFRRQYEWILVDEAQEINKAQFEIVNSLASGNCIYFGNDDEAIYAFRGSMVDNFKYIYESLSPENIFFLKKDYRSSPVLNKISQSFILQNRNRITKESSVLDESLIRDGSSFGESSEGSKDGEFVIKRFSSLLEEASFVC